MPNMKTSDQNIAAFAHSGLWTEEGEHVNYQTGMSLRDYFAGQALAGLMAHPSRSGDGRSMSRLAYNIADSMLVERGKE